MIMSKACSKVIQAVKQFSLKNRKTTRSSIYDVIIKGGYNQGYHLNCFSSIQYRVTVRVTSTMLSNLLHIAHNVIYNKYVYQFKRNERVIDTFNAIVSIFLCSKKTYVNCMKKLII